MTRALCTLVFAALVLAGCVAGEERTTVTAGAGSGPTKPTRPAPARPAGLLPERMVVSTAGVRDTDGNGYPDTVLVIAYLFGDSSKYELPIQHPGEFAFRITSREGERIGQWNFTAEQSAESAQQFFPGPGYAFGLRLRAGVDQRAQTEALIEARYRDAKDKREVRSNGVTEVVLGAGGG